MCMKMGEGDEDGEEIEGRRWRKGKKNRDLVIHY